MEKYGSPKQQTEAIIKSIIDNVHEAFPVEAGTKSVHVKNVSAEGLDKFDPNNYYELSQIKAHDKTFGVPIYGDVELHDGGKIIQKKRMKLATAPAMAGDGTFVVQGSQYSIDKQLRLRPGIYSRIKQNGEIEAHVNPNGFKNMRLSIDPATSKLTINVNQANINALPVLNALGVSDHEIRKTFGEEIYQANIAANEKHNDSIKRFFKSVNPNAELPATDAEISAHLATELQKAKLDPKITEITLGKKFEHLDGKALVRGFQKVVNIAKGQEKPDDRDALAFKSIHSVEDFVGERLKKNKNLISFELKNRLRKAENLEGIINSGHLNKHIFSFFNSAALSEIPSQINPLSVINAHSKTTITGEGGIENEQAIMPESQALHPTHLGFLDPINTPESKKIGVTLNLAVNTKKVGNELYSKMKNVKTGREEYVSAIDAFHKTVALPGEDLNKQKIVTAIHNGKQQEVSAKIVTHQIENPYETLTFASQALPALNYNQGNRAGMASRHINQAISLKHREAPLVQVASPFARDGKTTVEGYIGSGHHITLAAKDEDGVVQKITKSHLIFKGKSGKIYEYPIFNHFDLQNKSYFHHELDGVKPGMAFKKGEVIADSNFTKDGVLALGTNLRTAYMPWKGLNFEDGIVVSETGAQKLTSNHLFQDHIDKDGHSIIVDKKKFLALYPQKYTKAQIEKIDDSGIAKAGVKLDPGDPYALVLHKTEGTKEDLMLNRLHKSLVQPYKDMSKTWEQLTPGAVTRSVVNNKNVKIHAQYESPAIAGDKLALRHGNKGVITAIVPDNELPHTKDGKPVEVIISPASVITRMSMGQKLEVAASKIAEKTGKSYVIENFAGDSQLNKIKNDMKKHGITDTEELVDPQTGKSFGNVLVGKPFVEKLFKTAKANVSARDTGRYDIDNKPIKGGDDGSKAIDQLTLYGLLSHGTRGIVNEVSTIKGDGNAQFWQNLQNGLPTPKAQVPFVYKKFESLLTASGVNITQDGSKKILTPLTDAQTKELAGKSEIKNFGMLNYNLEPLEGGLFDPIMTGGSNGQKWSKITLAHPVVNPMYSTAVKTLLGIKKNEFEDLVKTKDGHDEIAKRLESINVRAEIDSLNEALKTAPKTKANDIIKKLKVLKALDYLKMKPKDAYVTSVVPVVPPQFRPVFEIPGGHIQTHSLNHLYADLGSVNQAIKDVGIDANKNLSHDLYRAVGAIQGNEDPISKQNQTQGVKGAIEIITSTTSPKHGFFQNKVLRKQQDLSGRATAILNNNLNLDELGVPEKIAKVIYKPFAIKELINQGYTHKDASEHIDNLTDIGHKAVQAAMSDRPVLMNRAPSLHKFSIMAFKPKLTKGLSIEAPGLIVKPYSLDFDGDTLTLHVPATEKARKESFDLLPSKNLYNPGSRQLNYTPDQEAIIGLHLLGNDGQHKKINALLPKGIAPLTGKITKSTVTNLLNEVAEKHPDDYNKIASAIKDLGDSYATEKGFSVSLSDMPDMSHIVKQKYSKALSAISANPNMSDAQKVKLLSAADAEVKEDVIKNSGKNHYATMVDSGGRGTKDNLKQILFAPGLLTDHNGDVIPRPVLTNYSQGMKFSDYWTTLYGARKGSLDKQLMTSKPGALSKEVVNTTMNLVISTADCGTKHGMPMQTNDPNILGRYTTDGKLITKANIDSIRKRHESVIVRSPATCESSHGICQKCYGIDEYRRLPKIGDNIGIKCAQALSEPLTQAAMKTFHTGGVASAAGGTFGGFEHVQNFLQSPETFKNRGIMSKTDGTVTSVRQGATGGWHVEVNGEDHFVAPLSGDLTVKKGDKVKKGDLINAGIPHPKDAIELLGETQGLHKITDTLHGIYKGSNINVDRRNVEAVVRGMTGFGVIQNEGTHPNFMRGDAVPLSSIMEFNQKASKPISLSPHDAYGMILHKDAGKVKAGTRIDKNAVELLSKQKGQVLAKHEPIQYARTSIGVQQAPLKQQDWLARLGYRYLKRGLQEGATYGHSSDIHGFHPVPAFVTGQIGDPDDHGHY